MVSGGVRIDWIVDAVWLLEHRKDPGVVLVDAREWEDYQKYHIEGAVHYDAMSAKGGVRADWNSPKPAQLYEPERIARVFGRLGISRDAHVVVYDQEGWRSGFLLSVLEYVGLERFSYLDGGVKAWRDKGYPVSQERTPFTPRELIPRARPEYLVDNAFVMENLDKPGTVVVDVRSLELSNGLVSHERAKRAGRIPGSVQIPFTLFFKDNAWMRSPEEILFYLGERGVTRDKTIILTSNTGARGGSSFFALKWLGYPDVRVHDQSWVGWCAQYCN